MFRGFRLAEGRTRDYTPATVYKTFPVATDVRAAYVIVWAAGALLCVALFSFRYLFWFSAVPPAFPGEFRRFVPGDFFLCRVPNLLVAEIYVRKEAPKLRVAV